MQVIFPTTFIVHYPGGTPYMKGVGMLVTTDPRQFILFYLFHFSLFLFLFAYLRFGSHFRSHDSHVTGEHMVELGAIFCCCFSARANSSSTYKYKDTYTVYLK